MNLHSAPPPFEHLTPPTRFAAARDLAVVALAVLLVLGFLAQVWPRHPAPQDPAAGAPRAASRAA